MIKILFVCHGNICRSPMAEFILKDMVKRLGREEEFCIDSAATTREELGNPVYPPARRLLSDHGMDCGGKTARLITREDADSFDLIIGMDGENRRDLLWRFGDCADRLHLLLDYAGREGEDIYDPWYTRDFRRSWDDIWQGCLGLVDALLGEDVTLDFSACTTRRELYAVLRRELLWQDFYGENLDALWDILTGLPHRGKRFTLLLPEESSPVYAYAVRMSEIFSRAEGEE